MKILDDTTREKVQFNPPYLGIVSVVSIIYLAYYLWWRATSTLNPHALFFSWALVLAEGFGAIGYLLFAWMTWDVSPTRRWTPPAQGLSVDVFVPTYNESLEILEATLIGCNKILYPHRTYVLDDGKRASVRQLASHLGCSYIARSTNEHAKAGNINYALRETHGDFIVILDADMVPQPDFLHRTLGYFSDERLAVVQTPQEFYNRDSIQHDQKTFRWHEQSLFFRVIQPGKNHTNSAFWCGSPSVMRRAALEDVGGVATETITEDIHTTVRLHSRGWSSYFVNEPLAYGIAPQTIQSFLLQRLRWAQGTMQLYRSGESPLWIRGLSLSQRLSYLASFLAYFESFQKVILILTPLCIIVFNIFPMSIGIVDFLVRWAPYFAITVLANSMGGRGHFRYFQTEKFNILKMVAFIQSTLTLLSWRALTFKVTPKSVDDTVYKQEARALWIYFAILGFINGAIVYGFIRLFSWNHITLSLQAYLIALAWSTYNAMLILVAVSEALSGRHERKHYRFRTRLDARLFDGDLSMPVASASIRDLSVSGVGFVTSYRMPLQQGRLVLQFETPLHKQVSARLSAVRQVPLKAGDRYLTGATISAIGSDSREALFEYLYIDIPGRRLPTLNDNLELADENSGRRRDEPSMPSLAPEPKQPNR